MLFKTSVFNNYIYIYMCLSFSLPQSLLVYHPKQISIPVLNLDGFFFW